jgi:hypothetical protein
MMSSRLARKYSSHSEAVTEYKEFPGRAHFTLGQEGWQEVADYALDWAVEKPAASVPA